MTEHCPVPECKASLVPKKWLWMFLLLCLAPFGQALYTWSDSRSADLKYAQKEDVNKVKGELKDEISNLQTEMALTRQQLSQTTKALERLNGQLEKENSKHDSLKEELKDLILKMHPTGPPVQ